MAAMHRLKASIEFGSVSELVAHANTHQRSEGVF